MRRISGKFHDGFRDRMEEQGIKLLLVTVDQWVQFGRACENDMIVINIQHVLILGINPELVRQGLAHRAGPVPAGIVVELYMSAAAASGNIYPISPCLTVQDVADHFFLLRVRHIGIKISRVESLQHILHGRSVTHCTRPPPLKE